MMAGCSAKYPTRLSGTVHAVHTVVGVATDNYEALKNKPKLNGVELSGDLSLAEIGIQDRTGASFFTTDLTVGVASGLIFERGNIKTYGKDIDYGSVILTADGKLFVVTGIALSSDGPTKYTGTLFRAMDADCYTKAEMDTILGAYVDDVDALIGGDS